MSPARLADLCGHDFDPYTQAKGEDYFVRGRARLQLVEPGNVQFFVFGSEPYLVRFGYLDTDDESNYTCTCPHYRGGENCKHIWAALLEIERLALVDKVLVRENTKENYKKDPEPVGLKPQTHWKALIERTQSLVEDKKTSATKYSPKEKSKNMRLGSYAIDLEATQYQQSIQLQLLAQERLKSGKLGSLKPADLTAEKIPLYEDPHERGFLWDILGRAEPTVTGYRHYSYNFVSKLSAVSLRPGHAEPLIRRISEVNKLFLYKAVENPYSYQPKPELLEYKYDSQVWNLRLSLAKKDDHFSLEGALVSEDQAFRPLHNVRATIENFVFFSDFMARSNLSLFEVWHKLLREKPLKIELAEVDSFLEYFFIQQNVKLPLELPEELQWSERPAGPPKIQIIFSLEKSSGSFNAKMSFGYEGAIAPADAEPVLYDIKNRLKLLRQTHLEESAFREFMSWQPEPSENPLFHGVFSHEQFLFAAERALGLGWEVLAEDQRLQKASDIDIKMSSGIDWFHVDSEIKFDLQSFRLPELIAAYKSGKRLINLGEGQQGLLPQEWFQRFAPLYEMSQKNGDELRLSKVQALFLSAELKDQDSLGSLQKWLTKIREIKPKSPDPKFRGKLRSYQKTGLSWLSLLNEAELGGILADDMGLGKTVQILAFLSQLKKNKFRPYLILAPKSLLHNWQAESAKFTPHLKALVFEGPNRVRSLRNIHEQDLVIMTYHTLRSDIDFLKDIPFDITICDEAQCLKNSKSQIHKATRLIQSRLKFALTGTPVENSLLDLFAILQIIAPGLFTDSQAQRWAKETDDKKLQQLSKALQPFILRRKKENVLKDLPEKSEQVLFVELSPTERKKYDELKNFYWAQLSGQIEEQGLAKSKIHVLEALLRLRQASCHQGLLDQKLRTSDSAKFELVLERVENVLSEDHKILVFSQFTSLLELFAEKLRALRIQYEYLDGQTENRAERVAHFQNNPDCKVFLLSLKAGGVGLNLTKADYVYILDPWWNPATESQAIDRSHRIGQKNKVFAYKVIAKDTVEEKILSLQNKKRNLADSLINQDVSLLKNLKFSDLQDIFN
jgi:superfamily II DNA or RNA helicase